MPNYSVGAKGNPTPALNMTFGSLNQRPPAHLQNELNRLPRNEKPRPDGIRHFSTPSWSQSSSRLDHLDPRQHINSQRHYPISPSPTPKKDWQNPDEAVFNSPYQKEYGADDRLEEDQAEPDTFDRHPAGHHMDNESVFDNPSTSGSQRTLDFDDLPSGHTKANLPSSSSMHLDPAMIRQAEEKNFNLNAFPTSNTTTAQTIADPLSLAGQQVGALLTIMRMPQKIKKITKGSAFNMVMEVGDCVRVLGKIPFSDQNGKDYMDYAVENMRTGARVIVAWNTFLPVGMREMCDCRGQRCRCVYLDFEWSKRFSMSN